MKQFSGYRDAPRIYSSPVKGISADIFSILPTNDGRIIAFGKEVNLLFRVSGAGLMAPALCPEGAWAREMKPVQIHESFIQKSLEVVQFSNDPKTLVYVLHPSILEAPLLQVF